MEKNRDKSINRRAARFLAQARQDFNTRFVQAAIQAEDDAHSRAKIFATSILPAARRIANGRMN